MATQGYRAQLPRSVVQRIAATQPGVGSAIGRGIEQLGQAALRVSYQDREFAQATAESQGRIAELERNRARATEVADGMGRLSQMQLDTEQALQGLRDVAEPGAPGYAAKAAETIQAKAREFEGTLSQDREVREHFGPLLARWQANAVSGERGWERERRVTHIQQSFDSSLDTATAGLVSKPDPQGWQDQVAAFDSAIDLQELDGTAKTALKQQVRERMTSALFDGLLMQGGFEAVEAAAQSGRFDAWLGGAQGKARWLDRVGAERTAAARLAEAQADATKRAAVAELDTIEALTDAGEAVPQGRIEGAIAAAQAAGVPQARLVKFGDSTQRAGAARAARGMETPELETQLQALTDKRARGAATPAEVRAFEAFEGELKARDVAVGRDIKALAASDPAGATQRLAAMPVERRWAAAREAGAERLAVYSGLTARGREFAIEGRGLRTAREADFYPPKTTSSDGGKEAADKQFRAMLGTDLIDQLGEAYPEHFEAALDLMAGTARGWNEDNFRRAVQMVFGATRRSGTGDGAVWQGGIGMVRGHRVELPPLWTADEFDKALSRIDFARAGATYADGTAATNGDVLRHFRPRYVGDEAGVSLYWLIGPDGRPLGNRNGSRTVVRVGRNP